MIIDNIEQIEHPQLVKDIKSLCLELSNVIVEIKKDDIKIELYDRDSLRFKQCNTIIRDHILGINRPMCIIDGGAYLVGNSEFQIELLVDYQITHGYKPYQSLDKVIHLYCKVSKEIFRDNKLDTLIYGL